MDCPIKYRTTLERAAVNVNHALLPREGGDLRRHAQLSCCTS